MGRNEDAKKKADAAARKRGEEDVKKRLAAILRKAQKVGTENDDDDDDDDDVDDPESSAQKDKGESNDGEDTADEPQQNQHKKLKLSDRKAAGLIPINEQQIRIYIIVAYAIRFNQPPEDKWRSIVGILEKEVPVTRKTIYHIFRELAQGKDPTKRKEGGGRKRKLLPNNEGLAAAAVALNEGQSPMAAMQICNQTNKRLQGDNYKYVCRNTMMDALQYYTDVREITLKKQYKIAIDVHSGQLKPEKEGGVLGGVLRGKSPSQKKASTMAAAAAAATKEEDDDEHNLYHDSHQHHQPRYAQDEEEFEYTHTYAKHYQGNYNNRQI